jgi:Lon protease-like protein
MFPLGSVLVPTAILPLHVFEPRYRALVDHCRNGLPEFGVVLIERGSEVGGGDTRFRVGTVARMLQVADLPDGRSFVVSMGDARFEVVEWLPDDPFPRARVRRLDPSPTTLDRDEPGATPDAELRDAIEPALRRLLALHAELGDSVAPLDAPLAEHPELAGWEAIAMAPIATLDRQVLLEIPDVVTRLTRLAALIDDATEAARERLAFDDEAPDA